MQLASLPEPQLSAALEACGMSDAVVGEVLRRGPFSDDDALCSAVDVVITGLPDAVLKAALERMPPPGVERGDPDALEAALLAVRLYRERFGYPFVSGIDTPTAEELLMRVRIRLGNDPEPEGRAAREHLRRRVRREIRRLQETGAEA